MGRYLFIFDSPDNQHHVMLADDPGDFAYQGKRLEQGAIITAFGQDWLITELDEADSDLPQLTCTLYPPPG